MAKKDIEIIHSDADLLIVNKPAGVAVEKDNAGSIELIDRLARQKQTASADKLYPIHRIDTEISGITALAKSPEAQKKYKQKIDDQKLTITYLVLITGVVTENTGRIETLITRSKRNPDRMVIPRKKGVPAVTNFRLLANFFGAALLAATDITNRKHQVRVHLNAEGLDVAADKTYGSHREVWLSDFKSDYRLGKFKTEKPLINRPAVHAYQIDITADNEKTNTWTAKMDKDFAAVIKMLAKHNPYGPDAFVQRQVFERLLKGEKL